ncbi:type III-A CRISPR-associated protein Cas10/Csm1 [Deferrisoma camini]|uniref:type III-A CRISPR-associated protein Cas10/Csm1 n=1 Tax=Deferrisoma camini TaxID=1035120 RepID=UPI00046CA097|nr:type III-A CRISPR-associated protein Cas10/Csm1 [Deferrisoma camini]
MTSETVPVLEVALAGLVHDVGKFMQRAHKEAELGTLAPHSAEAEGTYCPVTPDGRYTHRHVLWTDAFCDWLKAEVGAPPDLDLGLAQRLAVSHHRPDGSGAHEGLAACIAEGDRLSAGMDRRAAEEDAKGHRARNQPLRSPLAAVALGRGESPQRFHRLDELRPDTEGLYPVGDEEALAKGLPEAYARLWERFLAEAKGLRRSATGRHFVEGVQGLLERFTWAIPSSTVDLPDISLYDHSHTTAAFATCLAAYHGSGGGMDPARVRDREAPAFRMVVGDLSGIQRTLFTLASQGAKGVPKVLRARSFLLGAVVDAVAQAVLGRLGLPWPCRIQSAGGRFWILAPNTEAVDETVNAVAREVNAWLARRYLGELGLNLALTEPLRPAQFVGERFAEVLDAVGRAVDEAKARPLRGVPTGPLDVAYPHGPCSVCDQRPSAEGEGGRCGPCTEEERVGRKLPAARYLVFGPEKELDGAGLQPVSLPAGMGLALVDRSLPRETPAGWRIEAVNDEDPAYPRRFVATSVPSWEGDEWRDDPRYADLAAAPPDERPRPGAVKTFAHLARAAREVRDGAVRGRALLAILKADVDYLGFVFARGVPKERQSLSRYAALSRGLDVFFTAHLPWLIENDETFASTYTVYAGGDDLLLVGPWRQMAQLAGRLAEAFRAYVGENPNLTLSAAVYPLSPDASLARAAVEADEALDEAKEGGRDRVWLFGHVFRWAEYPKARETADMLVRWVDQKLLTRGFVRRLLEYSRRRKRASTHPAEAVWRAHLAYDLKRNVKNPEDRATVLELVGLGPDLRSRGDALEMLPAAVQWALNRLRT